jgi:hypothetical protein
MNEKDLQHASERADYLQTRRRFLTRTSAQLGMAAVASLLNDKSILAAERRDQDSGMGALGRTHTPAKAKRVIYLFQSGGPSHIDLFDHKPRLQKENGKDLPPSIKGTQRVTLMTRSQKRFPCFGTPFKFTRHGENGLWFSEIVRNMASVADDLCFLKGVHSEPINHDPAMTFMQTGRAVPGLPAMGSWIQYGLGSENQELPAFVVMTSGVTQQPVLSRYYHSGFLPSMYQGVQFQSTGDPVLFLSNPDGVSHANRGRLIESVNRLNKLKMQKVGDPEIQARIDSFEMAYQMQTSVPELTDISKEPKHILDMYGPNVTKQGTFAYQCLLARRLAERGVRFVQLFHAGWDQHGGLKGGITRQTNSADQPSAALISDLKMRGMLDDTLVIWGGEFGRTAYTQGSSGRDHHPRCFTLAMAGGGVKGGIEYGSTDDYGYNLKDESQAVHVNDFHATIMHLLGIDHERLTYRFGGRDFRLTDVAGKVVHDVLV